MAVKATTTKYEEAQLEAFKREAARSSEHLARAVEHGGLPTREELDKLYEVFSEASGMLEAIAYRVDGIGESDNGSDLPFTITLEHLGILNVICTDADRAIDDVHDHV